MPDYFKDMKRPMRVMLIGLAILFGGIFLWKGTWYVLMQYGFAHYTPPPITVSTATVQYSSWQPQLNAVGSLRAVLGVNITAQLGGMVQTIYFTPGTFVQQGTVLVQQNADPNIAQLHALEANAELARITYERDKAQYQIKAVSKQQLDSDEQNLKSLRAQVAEQTAIVAKLTIKAPFTGNLGISRINPGQYLNPGDTVVTLQSLNPIYVDFYLPQANLAQLKIGQIVNVRADTYKKEIFKGKITTINPLVDSSTRNVEVEATLENTKYLLKPGMFVNVSIVAGSKQSYLTVPQSAVAFNPYGDIIYIVKQTTDSKHPKQTLLTVQQTFVQTGETRGNQIAILQGLKAGDTIVTSGQLKLKNGSAIKINNTVQPSDHPNPKLSNEHNGS